jgi:hypothetical protein
MEKPLPFGLVFLCLSTQPYAGSLGFFFTLSLRLSLLSLPCVFGLFSLFFLLSLLTLFSFQSQGVAHFVFKR